MMKLRSLGLPDNSTIVSDLPPVSASDCVGDGLQLWDNNSYCCQPPEPGSSNYTCRRVRKTVGGNVDPIVIDTRTTPAHSFTASIANTTGLSQNAVMVIAGVGALALIATVLKRKAAS